MEHENNRKAVVLLSGGIDSSTALSIARAEGFEVYAVSFDYSQRHKRELESARMVAESLGVKKHLIINFDLRGIGGSALTDDIEVPKDRKSLNVKRKPTNIPVTYVPARNTIFLSFALGWAEVLGAGDIFIGANAIDYSGYPDCRPEYLKAFEDMANLAAKASVEGSLRFKVNAPLVYFTKAEIIRKGFELGLDYSLTWSCYDPQPAGAGVRGSSSGPPTLYVPCRKCDSCIFRERGFAGAGKKDPLLA